MSQPKKSVRMLSRDIVNSMMCDKDYTDMDVGNELLFDIRKLLVTQVILSIHSLPYSEALDDVTT